MTTYTFTPAAADDAPSVDQNGDPRFVTERDMADAEARWTAADDEAAEEYLIEYLAYIEDCRDKGIWHQ